MHSHGIHNPCSQLFERGVSQQMVGVVDRFLEHGGIFRLAFGPKAFIVVSDPVVVRYLLKASPAAQTLHLMCSIFFGRALGGFIGGTCMSNQKFWEVPQGWDGRCCYLRGKGSQGS